LYGEYQQRANKHETVAGRLLWLERMEQSNNLSYTVAKDVGVRIVTGDYPVATVIPGEYALSVKMNCSRTVIREAVKMLNSKGLLITRRSRGSIVESQENWNLLDHDVLAWFLEGPKSSTLSRELSEIRVAVEPVAAELAALKMNLSGVERISDLVKKIEKFEGSYTKAVELELEFHRLVLEGSGNRFYLEFMTLIETTIRLREAQLGFKKVDLYQKFVVALKKKNSKQAHKLMRNILA